MIGHPSSSEIPDWSNPCWRDDAWRTQTFRTYRFIYDLNLSEAAELLNVSYTVCRHYSSGTGGQTIPPVRLRLFMMELTYRHEIKA